MISLTWNNFTHNHCESTFIRGGGGIIASSSTLMLTGNTTFLDNRANFGAGGVYLIWLPLKVSISSTTQTPVISILDLVLLLPEHSGHQEALKFAGTSNVIGNSANFNIYSGGTIYVTESTLSFSGTSNFDQNLGYVGGAINPIAYLPSVEPVTSARTMQC